MAANDDHFEETLQRRIEPIIRNGASNLRSLQRGATELEQLRLEFPDHAHAIYRALLMSPRRLQAGLTQAQALQNELRSELDKMTEPPWLIGRVARVVEEGGRLRVAVYFGSSTSLVELSDAVDPGVLEMGDCVYLSPETNMVMGRAPTLLMSGGDTALFDRVTSDGRLVLKHRDEEFVVTAAPTLDLTSLKSGDRVRWDRPMNLALEFIEDS